MGLRLLPKPCWIGLWQGPDVRNDVDHLPHYATAEAVPSYGEHPGRAARHLGCGGVVSFGVSAGYCVLCREEGLGEDAWEERDYLPARLDVPCLEAACGQCGDVLSDEEEELPYCLPSLQAAQRIASQVGRDVGGVTVTWIITDDGQVWCPGCRPPGLYPQATPAEQEKAGQLRLPLIMP
jgi:hypothetical protein